MEQCPEELSNEERSEQLLTRNIKWQEKRTQQNKKDTDTKNNSTFHQYVRFHQE